MQVSAATLAPAAREWLRTTQRGCVLHVFARACNIVNEQNAILSLVNSPHGLGPFALQLSSSVPFDMMLDSHVEVACGPNWLCAGPLGIDVSDGDTWRPHPAWERLRARPNRVAARLGEIRALLDAHAPEESIARLTSFRAKPRWLAGELAFAAADPQLLLLAAGLAESDANALAIAANALAGLGPGLTPAGDDYLVGVVHGLYATRPEPKAARLSQTIAEAAAPRTNTLSAAWLRAAARGEASAHWHALVDALAAGGPLEPALLRIIDTGHTSGADALAGFMSVLAGERQ